jgi:hypothetical protein
MTRPSPENTPAASTAHSCGRGPGAAETPAPPPAAGELSPHARRGAPSPVPVGEGAQSSPPAPPEGTGGEREEVPGGRRMAAGTSPARDAPGTAQPSAAAPGGKTGLEAWQQALSDLHAAQRRGRGRYGRKTPGQRFGPGMARRMPPGPRGGDAA